MSNQEHRKSMDTMDQVCKIVRQSSHGIKAIEISKKLGVHKTTVHRALFSLEQLGMVESKGGVWSAKSGEQTIKPLEKEIMIELPIPKDQWRQIALLEMMAKDCEDHKFPLTAEMYRIPLEKLRQTRIIKITGKNVDDIDLEKLGNLIQQANQKSSLFDFKRLFKNLKRKKEPPSESSET